MGTLEKALMLAAAAHAGQLDKAGQPYILHPLRQAVQAPTLETQILAVLHDVVEDSATTLDDLRMAGFDDEIVSAVDALTRRDGEDYFAYLRRAVANPLARVVKRLDLLDNMDLTRLPGPLSDGDIERLRRYKAALAIVDGAQA